MTCPLLGSTCATVDQLIAVAPEFEFFGGPSKGQILLTGNTLAGETLTIGDVVLTAVAGVPLADQWSIDGTVLEQANSLLLALQGVSLVSYIVAEKVFGSPKIKVTTLEEGLNSSYPWSTTSTSITLAPGDKLNGGDCDIAFYLGIACSMLNKGCWGTKTLPASIYIAAHLMAISLDEDSGVATSRGISAISEGYSYLAPTGLSDPYWNNTKWGRLYLALWQTILKMPVVSGGLIPRSWPAYGRRGCRW